MTTPSDYELARTRLLRRRKFRADVAAYLVINAFLVGIWAAAGFGYFWPGWVLAGWAVLLILDGWDTYVRRDVTEGDIQRELHKST
ncbi:MAG: 2TM domain-containing protein [Nocardioidaceae bacterium]